MGYDGRWLLGTSFRSHLLFKIKIKESAFLKGGDKKSEEDVSWGMTHPLLSGGEAIGGEPIAGSWVQIREARSSCR